MPGDLRPLLLLMPATYSAALEAQARRLGFGSVRRVDSREELQAAFQSGPPAILLSFCTGVIVPADLLASPGLVALNIHSAPPAYPGRDPHHFACYEAAPEYGATLHYMVPAVDQGPIVRVSTESVAPGLGPSELLEIGIRHGERLGLEVLRVLADSGAPSPDPSLKWTGPVRRRRDFLELCNIPVDISREEFERRLRATSMPGYANLRLALHGRSFRLEP